MDINNDYEAIYADLRLHSPTPSYSHTLIPSSPMDTTCLNAWARFKGVAVMDVHVSSVISTLDSKKHASAGPPLYLRG
jgi:hypothetical protein